MSYIELDILRKDVVMRFSSHTMGNVKGDTRRPDYSHLWENNGQPRIRTLCGRRASPGPKTGRMLCQKCMDKVRKNGKII